MITVYVMAARFCASAVTSSASMNRNGSRCVELHFFIPAQRVIDCDYSLALNPKIYIIAVKEIRFNT